MGKKWRYGVIIDAGSSGSRLHVYRWKDHARAVADATLEELHGLPKIKTKWTKKIRPGISTFGARPDAVGTDHLQQLIDYALEVVPADMVPDTPIYLMATAGMRLLPAAQQTAVLHEACSYLKETTSFALPDADTHCRDSIQIIPGETEGLFGWLAANYLLGGFDHPELNMHGAAQQQHHTYGFLDMGGASAQIAFAPNRTEAAEHADSLTLVRLRTLDGQLAEHRVFSATWLGFGVNKARESYVQALAAQYESYNAATGALTVYDPCLPHGLRTTLDGRVIGSDADADAAQADGTVLLVGAGDFARCLVETKPLLAKDRTCGSDASSLGPSPHPCLIHDAVPSIDFGVNHFVGVSEYYHSTHGFFGDKDGDHVYDFSTYQRNVLAFCDQDWSAIAAAIGSDSGSDSSKKKQKQQEHTLQDAQQACFKASWVINVLHEGIGIPRIGLEALPGFNVSHEALESAKDLGFAPATTAFQPVDKIDSVEVSWTLGRMLLYAAGQVPPAESSSRVKGKLPEVGYGSNVRAGSTSTPSDFVYAGSTWVPAAGDDADSLLGQPHGSSLSGLVVLGLLALALLAFVLRRRERRMRLFGLLSTLVARQTGRSRAGGSPRLHKASSSGGSSSGTDKHTVLSTLARLLFGRRADYERVLEEGRSSLDPMELGDMDLVVDDYDASDSSSSGLGSSRSIGSGLSTLDRSGLVVRTESRERLAVGNSLQVGRRSRAGSPTRMKSPLMTPLSED